MYAIFLQIDDSEWDYLREYSNDGKNGTARSWSSNGVVKLFEYENDAIAEAQNWNTASVQEVDDLFVEKVRAYQAKQNDV